MKILSLLGSHRKRGNTGRILGLLRSALEQTASRDQEALEWKTLVLSELDIRPCRGCRRCFDKGEEHCPNRDDLLALRDEIAKSDGVILGSPVYVNDVSGTTKTVIDRLAFICHRPQFMKTPFLLLATTGETSYRHTLRSLQSAAISWGAPIAGSFGFEAGALAREEEIGLHASRAAAAARMLYDVVRRQRTESPSLLSLMVFAIQQRAWRRHFAANARRTVDYQYWNNSGWLDPSATFFYPHRAPRLRVMTARGAAAVIGPFVS